MLKPFPTQEFEEVGCDIRCELEQEINTMLMLALYKKKTTCEIHSNLLFVTVVTVNYFTVENCVMSEKYSN